MAPRPVVDLADCNRCEGCIAVCPQVFFMSDAGFVDIAELDTYPAADVDEAIKNCPEDCIRWEET
jgi:ferredoxin